MKLKRTTPTQLFQIRQPRWHDRTVLLAKYKVRDHNEIVFTHAPTLDGSYYISGNHIKQCPINSNGTIDCYVVKLNDLEQLERE